MTEDQKQPIHKKIVDLRFCDVSVHIESEDSYGIGALNQLAIDDLALLIKDRAAYSSVFDEAEPGGDTPPDTKKSVSVETIQAAYQ